MKKAIIDNWKDLLVLFIILSVPLYMIFTHIGDDISASSQATVHELSEPPSLYCIDSKVVISLPNGYLYKLVDNKTVACSTHTSGIIKK